MGNRNGSPPTQYDNEDEETNNQPETDGTTQTAVTDPTQTEVEDEEDSSDDASDDTQTPDESKKGGSSGGSGAPVEVPTGPVPDEQPPETEETETKDEDEQVPEDEVESDEDDSAEEEEFEFVYGDIVSDRDDEEEVDNLVVVNLPDETVIEWESDEDSTLSERNPGYPPTDDVIVVVKSEKLEEDMPEWEEREEQYQLETLDEEGMNYECYPSLRLELEEPSHLRTS